jgi:hypothetical protein
MRAPSSQKCRLDLAPPLADRFILGFPIDYGPVLLRTTATGRVSGNFPGSPAELRFILTLGQGKITRLEIVQ